MVFFLSVDGAKIYVFSESTPILKGVFLKIDMFLDAVRTLNSLVAALSVNDGDYYDAIDIAFEEIRE